MKELKITRKEEPGAYPYLVKVLKNHTRSSDYMIQLMKEHISCDSKMCDYKACELDLFKPLRMPIEAYTKLRAHLFPLPILTLMPCTPCVDLRYMSLTESMLLPFADAHQPSKMTRAATMATKNLVSSSALGPIRGRDKPQGRRGKGRSNNVKGDDAHVVRV